MHRAAVALRSYRVDPPEVLQAAEHALDGVAVAVEEGREAALPFAIDLRRNVRRRAALLDLPPDGIGVVALVAVQGVASRQAFEPPRAMRTCAGGPPAWATRRWIVPHNRVASLAVTL